MRTSKIFKKLHSATKLSHILATWIRWDKVEEILFFLQIQFAKNKQNLVTAIESTLPNFPDIHPQVLDACLEVLKNNAQIEFDA